MRGADSERNSAGALNSAGNAAKTTKADALALSRAYDNLEISADGDSVYIIGGHHHAR